MRLDELNLIAFGPFTDRTLDFSDKNFHLVFGLNEAGKSSALRAIDALLYGIERTTNDNFLHKYADMKVGGKIANAAGREFQFARRKRQKKTLVTLGETEKPLPENSLDDFLKGIQQERFRRLFCIDHDEFRAGGSLMRELKGLANDSLVAASHGGGFNDVEVRIKAEADAIWAGRSKSKIKTGIADYQQAKKEKSDLEASVRKWKSLSDDLEIQQQHKRRIVDEQTKLDTEKRQLERLRDSLHKIAEWKNLNAQLAGKDITILPNDYSRDDRRECEGTLNSTRRRVSELDEELCTLESQLANVTQTPEVLQNADRIDALQQRVGAQLQTIEELAEAKRELGRLQTEVERFLAEVDSAVPIDKVDSLFLKREHKNTIQKLAQDEKSHRQQPRNIARDLELRKRDLSAIDEKLQALGEMVETRSLASMLQQATRHLDTEQELTTLRDELDELSNVIDRDLAALPFWDASFEQLVRSKAPMRETIDQFDREFITLTQQIQSTNQDLAQNERQLAEVRESIASAQRAKGVVTEVDLTDARQNRDNGWQIIKQSWLDDNEDKAAIEAFAGSDSLDAAFEQSIAESDNVADRLRREADRVAELAAKQEKEVGLARANRELTEQLQQLQATEQELQSRWIDVWADSGLRQPRTTQEMGAWIELRNALLAKADELDRAKSKIAKLEKAYREQVARILASVQTFASDFQSESLQAICDHAQQLVEHQQQHQATHRQLSQEQQRLRDELSELEVAEKQAANELQDWQRGWTDAMQWIGCDANATAIQATERVASLDDLKAAYQKWRDVQHSIASAEESRQRFEQEVQTLAQKVSPILGTVEEDDSLNGDATQHPDAIDLAQGLKEKLKEARKFENKAEELQKRRSEVARKLAETRTNRNELEARLAQFLSQAGLKTQDGLDEVEDLSRLAKKRQNVEAELRQLSAGNEFDSFVAQAEGTNGAELDSQIAQLEKEIVEQDSKRDEIVSRITELEREMQTIDGSDRAAQADQRAMNRLSQVYDHVGQFLRLKIAGSILRQQVERQREDNKDPLLAAASQFFAEMTCHEFVGLETNYDNAGQAVIVGIRESGEKLDTDSMSDGTLDPLFLSLRLAYLQDKLTQFEPMPLIVDDILIHLDDERALATLTVLAEFSKQTQVLFFTHHHRLRELAEANLSSDLAAVHELERRNARLASPRPR